MIDTILIGQSGGPTAAINASLAGVLAAAKAAGIPHLLGMRYGIEGFLQGRVADLGGLAAEDTLALLARTPSSFLGSCRCKLSDPDTDPSTCAEILAALQARGVGAFFYIGGNDSMDTIEKLSRYGAAQKSPIRFIGVPKTIDDDLCLTDHTPGYGSAAKFIAASVSEVLCDATVYDIPSVTVVEIMGRDAGWLAGAASLSSLADGPAPDFVLLPEADFDEAVFFAALEARLKVHKGIVVAASEGIHNAAGTMLCEMGSPETETDVFGHRAMLSGAGNYLAGRIHAELGCKARGMELSLLQRCASHLASAADLSEAKAAGRAAVAAALSGETGVMVAFRRPESGPYACETWLAPISDVANCVKKVPRGWLTPDGMNVTEAFVSYAAPLIQGEVEAIYQNGVPRHLSRSILG